MGYAMWEGGICVLLTLVLSGLGALGKYLVPRKLKKDGTPPKLE